MKAKKNICLALYPNSRGFGFACIEWERRLIDTGIVKMSPPDNTKLLKRARQLINYYKPDRLIIRNCENNISCGRSNEFIKASLAYAKEIHLEAKMYDRLQIRDVFEVLGATTKDEIVEKIIEGFPELAVKKPTPRKLWTAEDYNMGVFDAMALLHTSKYLEG